MARRTGGKEPVKLSGITAAVTRAFDEIQQGLFDAATANREANSFRNVSRDQLIEIMDGPGGFAYGGFCGQDSCEMEIKDKTKATIRVLPDPEFRSSPAPTTCAWCGGPSLGEAVWAKAY